MLFSDNTIRFFAWMLHGTPPHRVNIDDAREELADVDAATIARWLSHIPWLQ